MGDFMRIRSQFLIVVTTVAIASGALGVAGASVLQVHSRQSPLQPGAVAPQVVSFIAADMTGLKEVPVAGDPDGSGTALITINPTTSDVCVNISTVDIAAYTGLHIHTGATGVPGAVVIAFTPPAGTTGTFAQCVVDIDAASVAADPSAFYLNVHTADFPGGALRDQLTVREVEAHLFGSPERAFDTRNSGLGKFAASETRVIDLSLAGVPIGVRYAMVTLTATQVAGNSYLSIYSNAVTFPPNASNLNYSNGQDIATYAIVAVDGSGKIKISNGPGGTVHVIVDVTGYGV